LNHFRQSLVAKMGAFGVQFLVGVVHQLFKIRRMQKRFTPIGCDRAYICMKSY